MDVMASREQFEARNVSVVVISFSGGNWAVKWKEQTGCPYPLIVDTDREVYKAYRLEASVAKTWTPEVISYYQKQKASGRTLFAVQGDPHQLGGDFLVGRDGNLLYTFYSDDPTDRPAVKDLLEACP
eukprot:TRINITY_DN23194_c0_g1_i1.p2 TRINITY_DN23194_c0_g1~~TRINITY_DN23194_c0_g1_i1.p2  ORF type:complete len:127 (-),score=34.92 TRINITY_DN23194_c0_g1_i1:175-555(-)